MPDHSNFDRVPPHMHEQYLKGINTPEKLAQHRVDHQAMVEAAALPPAPEGLAGPNDSMNEHLHTASLAGDPSAQQHVDPTPQAVIDPVKLLKVDPNDPDVAARRTAIENTQAQLRTVEYAFRYALPAVSNAISGWMTFQGFWESDNTGEKFALVHSEISEALEADRAQAMDDKLPARRGVEVELADAVIRILDFCAKHNLDLAGAILEKMEYNLKRPPKHGKAY